MFQGKNPTGFAHVQKKKKKNPKVFTERPYTQKSKFETFFSSEKTLSTAPDVHFETQNLELRSYSWAYFPT